MNRSTHKSVVLTLVLSVLGASQAQEFEVRPLRQAIQVAVPAPEEPASTPKPNAQAKETSNDEVISTASSPTTVVNPNELRLHLNDGSIIAGELYEKGGDHKKAVVTLEKSP